MSLKAKRPLGRETRHSIAFRKGAVCFVLIVIETLMDEFDDGVQLLTS